MYVVLEGLDGVGTTTQARLLAEHLGRQQHVLLTREPSDGPFGSLIRRFLTGTLPLEPAAVALAFATDRLHHLANTVVPALASGSWVVSDRSVLSSMAYQSIENEPRWVATINRQARRADLTILLDAPADVCWARIEKRGGHREVYEQIDQLRSIRLAYLRAADAERLAGHRIVLIDGAPDEQTVHQSILRLLAILPLAHTALVVSEAARPEGE